MPQNAISLLGKDSYKGPLIVGTTNIINRMPYGDLIKIRCLVQEAF